MVPEMGGILDFRMTFSYDDIDDIRGISNSWSNSDVLAKVCSKNGILVYPAGISLHAGCARHSYSLGRVSFFS